MATVVFTNSSVQLRLSRVIRSGKSSKKGLRIRLISEMLKTCLWKAFCVESHCAWCWNFVGIPASSSGRYSPSNCLTSLANSGPEIIHRLKAVGFSVYPTAPPEPLTILFSCSCVWSKGIEENLFMVLESTQLPSPRTPL